jgi:hypothetical protein
MLGRLGNFDKKESFSKGVDSSTQKLDPDLDQSYDGPPPCESELGYAAPLKRSVPIPCGSNTQDFDANPFSVRGSCLKPSTSRRHDKKQDLTENVKRHASRCEAAHQFRQRRRASMTNRSPDGNRLWSFDNGSVRMNLDISDGGTRCRSSTTCSYRLSHAIVSTTVS